jgi:hypothetical protein
MRWIGHVVRMKEVNRAQKLKSNQGRNRPDGEFWNTSWIHVKAVKGLHEERRLLGCYAVWLL